MTADSKKKGLYINIEKATLGNSDFRRVLYTGHHLQLVVMTLKPKEEIGKEVHTTTDQFFRVESGKGMCTINNASYEISDGDVVIIPSGAKHNIVNTDSMADLKLYTIYAPPEHKDGIIRHTVNDANMNKEEFDGKVSE